MDGKRKGEENKKKSKKSRAYISSSESEEDCPSGSANSSKLADSPLMNPRVVLTAPTSSPNTNTPSATSAQPKKKSMPTVSISVNRPSPTHTGDSPRSNQAGPSQQATTTSGNNDRAISHASTSGSQRPGPPHAAASRADLPYTVRHGVVTFAGHGWVSLRDGHIRVYARRIQRELPRFQTMNFVRDLQYHHPNAEINFDWEERAIVVTGAQAELRTIDSLLTAAYISR